MDNMNSLAPNDQPAVDPNRRPNNSTGTQRIKGCTTFFSFSSNTSTFLTFHAESCACELFQLLMGAYYIIYICVCVCVCEIIYTCTVHLYNYTCVCIYVFIYLSIQFYSYFRVAHVPCIPFATWHTPTLLGCAMHGGPVASAQYLAGLREFLHLSRALSTIGSLAITMTCYDCAQVPGIARCEGGRKRPPCGPV
jgi:hypothetical protein